VEEQQDDQAPRAPSSGAAPPRRVEDSAWLSRLGVVDAVEAGRAGVAHDQAEEGQRAGQQQPGDPEAGGRRALRRDGDGRGPGLRRDGRRVDRRLRGRRPGQGRPGQRSRDRAVEAAAEAAGAAAARAAAEAAAGGAPELTPPRALVAAPVSTGVSGSSGGAVNS
jgi:hypothetical protein